MSFEESDEVLGKPYEHDSDEIECLAIKRMMVNENTPAVVSCWRPTKAEMEEINRTGRIWLLVCGTTMPPAVVEGFTPFVSQT